MDTLDRLRARMRAPLPGHDGFRELSGYQRPDLDHVLRRTPPPKESAVLVLLYPTATALSTLLILRPTYEGVHSGQVAFPGGHREPIDTDLRATALREFREETGAPTEGFEVLGELTRVFIPPSNTLVTPVLAWAPALTGLAPDPREVAGLVDAPIPHLLRDDILKRTTLYVRIVQRELDVPYWDIGGHVVWGATALMVAELRDLLNESGVNGVIPP